MNTGRDDLLGTVFPTERNLSMTERAIYVAVGLGMAAAGAKPRPNPLLNVLALAGGAYLAWTGYTGACPVKAALTDQSGSGSGRLTRG
jgi:threonine/homoserine/homoserine lactone efflux protein